MWLWKKFILITGCLLYTLHPKLPRALKFGLVSDFFYQQKFLITHVWPFCLIWCGLWRNLYSITRGHYTSAWGCVLIIKFIYNIFWSTTSGLMLWGCSLLMVSCTFQGGQIHLNLWPYLFPDTLYHTSCMCCKPYFNPPEGVRG